MLHVQPQFRFWPRIRLVRSVRPKMVEFRQESDLLWPELPLTPVLSNYVLSDINFSSYLAWSATASAEELDLLSRQVFLTLHAGPGQAECQPEGPYVVDYCSDAACPRCSTGAGGYKFRSVSSRWTPAGSFCYPPEAAATTGTLAKTPGAARFFCQRHTWPIGLLRCEPGSAASNVSYRDTLSKGQGQFRASVEQLAEKQQCLTRQQREAASSASIP